VGAVQRWVRNNAAWRGCPRAIGRFRPEREVHLYVQQWSQLGSAISWCDDPEANVSDVKKELFGSPVVVEGERLESFVPQLDADFNREVRLASMGDATPTLMGRG